MLYKFQPAWVAVEPWQALGRSCFNWKVLVRCVLRGNALRKVVLGRAASSLVAEGTVVNVNCKELNQLQ